MEGVALVRLGAPRLLVRGCGICWLTGGIQIWVGLFPLVVSGMACLLHPLLWISGCRVDKYMLNTWKNKTAPDLWKCIPWNIIVHSSINFFERRLPVIVTKSWYRCFNSHIVEISSEFPWLFQLTHGVLMHPGSLIFERWRVRSWLHAISIGTLQLHLYSCVRMIHVWRGVQSGYQIHTLNIYKNFA